MIIQGRAYHSLQFGNCIALETKESGPVRCLTANGIDLWPRQVSVLASELIKAPMRYHRNEIPQ